MAGQGEVLSLDELKQANSEAEEAAAKAAEEEGEEADPNDTEEIELVDNLADIEGGEAEGGEADDDGAETEEEEGDKVEPWMETDEEDEQAKFTDSDAANIRRKYKAREDKIKEEADEEKRRLQEEIDRLKQGGQERSQKELQRPSRDDFDDEDEYHEALTDWKINVRAAEEQSNRAAAQTKQQREQQQEEVSKAVDAHYLRAHELAQKSNISPEAYQSADLRVREAMEEVFPGAGDQVVDHLIAVVGEGSQKVFYHLGVNAKRRQEFLDTFKRDPNGLAAATYLGKLNTELSAPQRKSNAPAPGTDVHGDTATQSKGGGAAKKQYQQAHAKGDAQEAFEIKRAAKAKGIDTSKW